MLEACQTCRQEIGKLRFKNLQQNASNLPTSLFRLQGKGYAQLLCNAFFYSTFRFRDPSKKQSVDV